MGSFLKLFAVVLPTVLVLDYLWIGLVMSQFYDAEFGSLARRNSANAMAPRWPAAIMVYLILPASMVFFLRPHLTPDVSVMQAFLIGAAFGAAVYGVYDFTNYALLENWSLRLTLVDLAWGTFLGGAVAVVMRAALRWMNL
jgi:uncharacterized membrane protein